VALPLKPGELVVKRIRWQVDADLMGLVIGRDAEDNWLVLWTTGDKQTKFKWHLADALQVIDLNNVPSVAERGSLKP
jgi:hypothetical protein